MTLLNQSGNDLRKESLALFNQLMKNEITQEEFERKIRLLDQPQEADWNETEET